MIPEQRIASWAEEHAVKAKEQAGSRKDYRAIDSTFISSLIDKQQSQQKGNAGKLYCVVLWQVLQAP